MKQQLYGHLPSIFKTIQDEQITREIAGEARTNSSVTFFWGPLNMDVPVLVDQQKLTHLSSLEDMLRAEDDRDGWKESVKEIRIVRETWW